MMTFHHWVLIVGWAVNIFTGVLVMAHPDSGWFFRVVVAVILLFGLLLTSIAGFGIGQQVGKLETVEDANARLAEILKAHIQER